MKRRYWIVPFLLLSLLLCGWAANTAERRTELHIAAAADSESLRLLAASFDESQSKYRTVIDIYAPEDCERLYGEMASGSGPDVVDLSLLPLPEDLTLLEDLNAFRSDTAVRSEELMTQVLTSWEMDGALRMVPASFAVSTMTVRRADAEGQTGWNVADMERILAEKGSGWQLLNGWMTGEEYVKWIAALGKGLTEWDLQQNLRLAALLPSGPEQANAWPDASQEPSVAEVQVVQSAEAMGAICRGYGEDITFVGFPVEEGDGQFLHSEGPLLGISSASLHKDAAGQLVALALGRTYQQEMTERCGGFSVRRDVFDAALEKALAEVDGFSEREAKQLRQLTDQTHPVTTYDPAAVQRLQDMLHS